MINTHKRGLFDARKSCEFHVGDEALILDSVQVILNCVWHGDISISPTFANCVDAVIYTSLTDDLVFD